MYKFAIITLLAFGLTSISWGKVEIGKLKFSKNKSQGKIFIDYSGNFGDYPELIVNKSSVLVSIPDATVNSVYDRRVNFSNEQRDTRIRSFQYKKNMAHIKATVPFNIKALEQKVSLTIKDNKIELSFPRVKVGPKKFQAKQALKDVREKNVRDKKIADEVLNEKFLANLEREEKKRQQKKVISISPKKSNRDVVKTTMSAREPINKEKRKSSFSLVEYGGKFVAFLGLILLLFYGLIVLMKKGVIKKGKLGFLNHTDQVQVIGQTYIAPKKSLMMIKAHDQVFLVSNTDSGINLISEIRNAAGYLKEGEKIISGNNFDDSLNTANSDEMISHKIKLKEDIALSNQRSALSSYKEVKEKVKFSDQLKKKVKNLKPLQ